MAFEGLTEKLQGALRKLSSKGKLTEDNVKEGMREVRMALLEADVNYAVAKDFIKKVTARCVGTEITGTLSASQQVIKIVNEEMTQLMGGENARLTWSSGPLTVYMLCGLQGAGKTTMAAKLANYLAKQGKKPMLAACDIYRPAAINQLQVVGKQVNVPVYEHGTQDPVKTALEAVERARYSMNAMTEAREYALLNRNPVIVHANCVRIGSHSNSDKHTLYRDEGELAYVKAADPLMKFRRMLLRYKRFTEEELKAVEEKAKKDLSAANRKALAAPDPDPEAIFNYVLPESYEPEKYKDGVHHETEGEKVFLVNSINETLKAEFRRNPDTFIWGQDVANKDKGGVFNVTKGMQQEFGEARVFSAPIAEDYIVGTANGMSRFDPKIRVVIEGAEFADYFWPAVEQYVECTHEYWRSNGKFVPNVTLRLASGGYIGGGLYHSQNIEGALATLPGARIVYPSFADDAAGLLRTSMRSRGFTLFLEPKALYNSVEAATVVPDDFEVPFGKARIRREGSDLSIITYGNTTHLCLNVAERLEKEGGWKVEVIDIRSLIPLDRETIYGSVKKTGKALVVHEDKVFGGFGGEIAAGIGSDMFRYLDAPVQRVGSTFTPVGFNPILERAVLPDADRIYEAAKKLLEF